MDALSLERCRLCPNKSSGDLVQEALAVDEIREVTEAVERVSTNPRTVELLSKLAVDTAKRIEESLCDKGPWLIDKEVHCGKFSGVVYIGAHGTEEVKRGQ